MGGGLEVVRIHSRSVAQIYSGDQIGCTECVDDCGIMEMCIPRGRHSWALSWEEGQRGGLLEVRRSRARVPDGGVVAMRSNVALWAQVNVSVTPAITAESGFFREVQAFDNSRRRPECSDLSESDSSQHRLGLKRLHGRRP